jgi:menaquinone-dependent protoporphyrinogen IX oxidase
VELEIIVKVVQTVRRRQNHGLVVEVNTGLQRQIVIAPPVQSAKFHQVVQLVVQQVLPLLHQTPVELDKYFVVDVLMRVGQILKHVIPG